MSKTSSARTTISRTSSILLSPSKRRKLEGDQSSRTTKTRETTAAVPVQEDGVQQQPTSTDILRWTFTRAAIASCFVKDVFEMKESGTKDMEYFWLGCIPCRTVRLVGVVVGVQVWEKRTVYTIDDGTAVVDCALAHAQVPPASPVKLKSKSATSSKDMTKSAGSSFADYLPSSRKVPPLSATTNVKSINAEPPPPPKPAVSVGKIARIVGRVVPRFDARIILVDEISRCASYNDESNHSISVSELHRTTYYPSEPLPPFKPPVHTSHSSASHPSYPGCLRSPSKRATTQVPQTPASSRSITSSTTTSPSTSVATSSPSSSTSGEVRVPRLRHPLRLRTRDLTANTFRIYVKHYMDNAPPPRRKRGSHSRTRSVSPSPTPRLSQARRGDLVATPTKSRHGQVETGVDATPRCLATERTPRASLASAADSDDESDDEVDATYGQLYGYTLSHLRRVPELSLLARRVVKTEAHCRAKEERKKAKSQKSQPASTSASSGPGPTSRSSPDIPHGPAVKRLFKQAIRTLFSEGEVVLWNGPVRPLLEPVFDPLVPSSLGLWKANTSTSSAATSSTSRSAMSYDDWDDDEALSEPTRGEEAYVPLTPAYFSRVLEGAIRTIMAQAERLGEGEGEATPKPKAKSTASSSSARGNSLIERLRAQEKENAGPPPGPTKEQLLAWLRGSDERWARVGEWTVEEALQWGKREGRLWCVGKGCWEVCGSVESDVSSSPEFLFLSYLFVHLPPKAVHVIALCGIIVCASTACEHLIYHKMLPSRHCYRKCRCISLPTKVVGRHHHQGGVQVLEDLA